jgi:hypothetical protein
MNSILNSGGEPELLAECSMCGKIYPAQWTNDDTLRPIGNEGSCECGSDVFDPVSG